MVVLAFGSNIFGQTAPDNGDCCIEKPEPLCDLDAVLFSAWEVTVGVRLRPKNRVLLFGHGGTRELILPSTASKILSLSPLVYLTDQGRIVSTEESFLDLRVHDCAVLRDGRVYIVTDLGRLCSFYLPGTSTSPVSITRLPDISVMTPEQLTSSPQFVQIACGDMHTLGLSTDGEVYSWGSGRFGQLGHGQVMDVEMPKVIHALQGIRIAKVACGAWHSAVLSAEDGDLYAFGWNKYGQLGVDTAENEKFRTATPRLVEHGIPSLDGSEEYFPIKEVACGAGHTAAVSADGRLWTCGWGKYGQLGRSVKRGSDWVFSSVEFTGEREGDRTRVEKVKCGRWNTFCSIE